MMSLVGRVVPSACVVDANVAVKLAISEEDSDLADLLDQPLVSADERLIRKAGGPNNRLILLASLR
jgi:predicted nucleic acid-binding protein